jgi:hypothetical protein
MGKQLKPQENQVRRGYMVYLCNEQVKLGKDKKLGMKGWCQQSQYQNEGTQGSMDWRIEAVSETNFRCCLS